MEMSTCITSSWLNRDHVPAILQLEWGGKKLVLGRAGAVGGKKLVSGK